MKTDFYAQRPLEIDNKTMKTGALIATVETPAGVPLDRALAAIAGGHATPEKREDPKPAAEPKK